jgi:hypothetical protein
MVQRTTVRLPEDLLTRAKRKAAKEGRTVTSLIEEGLREVVAEKREAELPQRRMPRISQAKGGLLPGIDLADGSVLQELDDIADIEKLSQ